MTRRRLAVGVAAVAIVAVAAVAALTVPRLFAQPVGGVPHFVDEARSAGVVQAYTGDFDYFVGGGVAAFDCNADGRPELYFAGGASPAGLFVNESASGGELKFSRLVGSATDLTAVTGAYPIDFDGDGTADLAVLRHGENVLLRGTGDCRFERANETWGFDGGDEWSTAFTAKWDAGATWPTIAIGNYLSPERPDGSYSCVDNDLFVPSTTSGGFRASRRCCHRAGARLSLLFTDWDRSGRRDLRVSNDRHYYGDLSDGQEQLWRVAPAETPRQYTAADGWRPLLRLGHGHRRLRRNR